MDNLNVLYSIEFDKGDEGKLRRKFPAGETMLGPKATVQHSRDDCNIRNTEIPFNMAFQR